MAGHGWTWLEMDVMALNGSKCLKYLKIAGNVLCCLYMAGNVWNYWKWKKLSGNGWNGWKLLEIIGNGWNGMK